MQTILLVCGVPGAGKTTWIKEVVQCDQMLHKQLHIVQISFDNIFYQYHSEPFDPNIWKLCQAHFQEQLKYQINVYEASIETRQMPVVLLVEDVCHYRSMRKRFAKLAYEANCGFGIIYMNTDPQICRERNETRSGKERLPVEVMDHLIHTFEPPDKESPNTDFEHNIVFVNTSNEDSLEDKFNILNDLHTNGWNLLQACKQAEAQKKEIDNEKLVHQHKNLNNIFHQLDIELRKWVSKSIQAHVTKSSINCSRQAIAQLYNGQRKTYLAKLKTEGIPSFLVEYEVGSIINYLLQKFVSTHVDSTPKSDTSNCNAKYAENE